MSSPLFDAARRARRTTEPTGEGQTPLVPTLSECHGGEGVGHKAASGRDRSHAQRLVASMARTHPLAVACAVAFTLCLSSPVAAENRTMTYLYPADLDDTKNAVAQLVKEGWATEIKATSGAIVFTYTLFEVGDVQYLLSRFEDQNCTPRSCSWKIQKLDKSYRLLATSDVLELCGAINEVDVTADKLTVCGEGVKLP